MTATATATVDKVGSRNGNGTHAGERPGAPSPGAPARGDPWENGKNGNGRHGKKGTNGRVDLRTRRDLVGRRLWRERSRRLLRTGALAWMDALGAALVLGLGLAVADAAPGSAWSVLPLAAVLTVLTQAALRTYGPDGARRDYTRASIGGLVAMALLLPLAVPAGLPWPGPGVALGMGLALGGIACLGRWSAERGIRWAYRRGFGARPTLLVGDAPELEKIGAHVRAGDDPGVRLLGRVEPRWRDAGEDALADLSALAEVIEGYDVRSVIISARLGPGEFHEVARQCLLQGCAVSVVPATLTELPVRISSYELLGWPLLELEIPRLHLFQVVLKRSMDLALGLAGLLLAAPVLALLAIAVRLDSPGPVLFRQRRLGVGGRRFTIYKFRTMRADAEEVLRSEPELYREYVENDFKLPADRDPRITRLGAFLRRTSLDELPQLLNVLRGDMSLVGPRPIVPDEIENYGEEASVFLAVKPGVTGYWQVNGRSSVGYPERADLDIEYIRSWSVLSDLRILLRTAGTVFGREGAF